MIVYSQLMPPPRWIDWGRAGWPGMVEDIELGRSLPTPGHLSLQLLYKGGGLCTVSHIGNLLDQRPGQFDI